MVPKGSIELLVQQHPFLPKARLLVKNVGQRDRPIYEPTTAHDLFVAPVGVEGQCAAGNASGLLADHSISCTSNGEAHIPKPNPHRAPKLYLAAVRLDSLA